jgi:hypothetical protein
MRAFWIGVALLMLVAAAVWLGHDYLQAKADIHSPDSPTGRKIDEHTPLEYVHQYQDAKRRINLIEMDNIRKAIAMYQINMGRNPESIEDLVTSRCIGEGALQDTFNQDYRLREVDGRWFLLSSGNDEILYTDDDVMLALDGVMEGTRPAKPTETKPPGRNLDWYPNPQSETEEPSHQGP